MRAAAWCRIALHKLEELSSWDEDVLKAELQFFITYDVDLVTHTAFSSAEIDAVLYAPCEETLDDPDDALPELGKRQSAAAAISGNSWAAIGLPVWMRLRRQAMGRCFKANWPV